MNITFAFIAIAAGLVAIQVLLLIAYRIITLIVLFKCVKKVGIKRAVQIGESEQTTEIELKKAMAIGDGEKVESLGIGRGKQIRELEDIMLSSPRLFHMSVLISKVAFWPVTIRDHFSK